MNPVPWFFCGSTPKSTDWNQIWGEAVDRFSGRSAFRFASGEMDYAEVNVLAGEVTRLITSAPGWRAGALISLSTLDPAFPWKAIGIWLAGGVIVPFNRSATERNPSLRNAVGSVSEWVLEENGNLIFREDKCPSTPEWHGIYFTSGSTGEPKGVVRGWRQALYEAGHYASLLNAEPGLVCTMLIDPSFGASTKHFLGCLLSGCVQILASDAQTLSRGGHVLYGTPAHISSFRSSATSSFTGYSWISLTGEPCSLEAWRAVRSLASADGMCLNALGGSEFGVALNMIIQTDSRTEPPSALIGQGSPGKNLTILDEEGNNVRQGEPGLLGISSPWIAEGYLDLRGGLPVFESFSSKGTYRHFLSGDVVIEEDTGSYRHLGRSGSMLKRHGTWLDTTPLREILLGSPLGITESVVVRDQSGEGFTLWVEMKSPDLTSLERVSFLVTDGLPKGVLIPDEIIAVGQLPRNRHGKIDLRGLDAMSSSLGLLRLVPCSRIMRIASAIALSDYSSSLFRGVSKLTELELDSLEYHEIGHQLVLILGREVPMEILLSDVPLPELTSLLQEKSHSGFTCFGNSSHGRRILWFGPGAGTIIGLLGGEYEIHHWNCDWITRNQGDPGCESMVEYARRMLALSPAGTRSADFVIGGFSFGALIAHEASLLMADSGCRPKLTILLDPPDLEGRLVRTGWRWSRWRPFILRWILGVLAPLFPGKFGSRMQRMESMQNDGCTREIHRSLMRHYRPSTGDNPAMLLTSREFHQASCAVFETALENLEVRPLPVDFHHQVMESSESIKSWIAAISVKTT
jgi:acyl-CoA synthetase (AMP-forming)/AMP-acid ligase II